MDLNIVENATCTFCGCVCDDIELHADELRIHEAKRACILGKAWFLNHTAEHKYPDALVDGREATLDEAIEAAADYLYNADMPLVYGMSNTTCEAQRECASLADRLGGLLDSHTSL
jgi:formylmethanofuran dehydrogenase subunit B